MSEHLYVQRCAQIQQEPKAAQGCLSLSFLAQKSFQVTLNEEFVLQQACFYTMREISCNDDALLQRVTQMQKELQMMLKMQ